MSSLSLLHLPPWSKEWHKCPKVLKPQHPACLVAKLQGVQVALCPFLKSRRRDSRQSFNTSSTCKQSLLPELLLTRRVLHCSQCLRSRIVVGKPAFQLRLIYLLLFVHPWQCRETRMASPTAICSLLTAAAAACLLPSRRRCSPHWESSRVLSASSASHRPGGF